MQELPKPWFDLQAYKKTRLLEAKFEAEIARKFLEEGLTRNAAGKAYQAWKAVVAALAAGHRERLRAVFPGEVELRDGRKVEMADWIIALMPSNKLKRVSQVIGGEVVFYTSLALDLHQYQHNGPDSEGILSRYDSDESAKFDILVLLDGVEKELKGLGIE